LADKLPPARREDLLDNYRIGCPDVLAIQIVGRPELSGPRPVTVDGRTDLGSLGRPRVEGMAALEVARTVAARAGLPASAVQVRVAEYRSQQLYLVGEVHGLQRAVAYEGPERVAELLQRAGGLAPGAAVSDVHVIRPHVPDDRTPEVFRVDLEAIVLHHDQRTNITLQPFDQVYVGETRRSHLEHCVHPLLLPFYRSVCGLWPS
jgi:polysaccharide biosynthesis/export protein